MSSADVVVAGTNAISNAYQGMIGAAADKKRRRMQSLLGIGQNIQDVVTQVKYAKDKRVEESESKSLAEALSLGLKDGDPSMAISTIASVQTSSPRVAAKKAEVLMKLMDDKRQVDQGKASLKLQEDQFAALKADRAEDNARMQQQNTWLNEDRDAQRKINDENRKAEIKLKDDKASAERVELVRKDRAAYDAAQIATLNSDLFTDSYDAEKNNGQGRADAFRARFEEQRKKMRDDSPEVIKAANETLEKLARLDQQDKVVKEKAKEREITRTKENATQLLKEVDKIALGAGKNILGKLMPKQGQDEAQNDILGAVMAAMENPIVKQLLEAGVAREFLGAKIENGIRAAIGPGRREEDGGDKLSQDKLDEQQYRREKNVNFAVPIDNTDFEAWKAKRAGKPKVDSKPSSPQTGGSTQTKTIGGKTYIRNEQGAWVEAK